MILAIIFFSASFIFFRIYKKKNKKTSLKITEKDFYKFVSFLTDDEQERKKHATLLTLAANDPDKFYETYHQDPNYEEILSLISGDDKTLYLSIMVFSQNSLVTFCDWKEDYKEIALILDLPKYPTAHYPKLQEIKNNFDVGIQLAEWVFKRAYPKKTLVFIDTNTDQYTFFTVKTSQLHKLRAAAKTCNIPLVDINNRPL